ncbi:hypothetical protein KBC86_00590 [Candidatus Gracilibacteria bacterium]|nr:hypothetical protein [Candidatus Gracilibacteria bacterium]
MPLKFTPPDQITAEFLDATGVAKAIALIDTNRDKVAGLTGNQAGFDRSHFHYLLGELIYHLQVRWNHGIPAQIDLFKKQKEELLLGGTLEDFSETIVAMKEIVMESGELFFSRIVSYERGEVDEDTHGGNRNFQSNLLAECILFAIRIGVESAVIERWKTKLIATDHAEVMENIALKPKSKEE